MSASVPTAGPCRAAERGPATVSRPDASRERMAFWLVTGILALAFASTTAPSVLYRRYQAEWHFSPGVLTTIFGVYAIAVIAGLLLTGSASDRRGRKPFILFALSLCVVSMVLFCVADNVWWLVLARVAQGIGVGVGVSALGGMLLDLRPGGRQSAYVNQAAPNVGIVAGSLGAGLLVDYGPEPSVTIYAIMLGLFLVTIPVVVMMPETVLERSRTVVRLGRIRLPEGQSRQFWLIGLGAISTWSVGGFYLSLGPTVSAQVLNSSRFVVGALAVVILGGAALVSQTLFYGWSFEREMVVGTALLSTGVGVVTWSMWTESTGLFFVGSIALGLGWGLTAVGSFRSIVALARPAHRAEVVAAVYVLCYLAFSAPSVAAGYATNAFGLRPTTVVFGIAVTLMAVIAARTAVLIRTGPAEPTGAAAEPLEQGSTP